MVTFEQPFFVDDFGYVVRTTAFALSCSGNKNRKKM